MAKRSKSPDRDAELAALMAEQARELSLEARGLASVERGAVRLDADEHAQVDRTVADSVARRQAPLGLGDVIHRDEPTRGRRPKVRAGTERMVFRDTDGTIALVVHTDIVTTARGVRRLDGTPVAPPTGWVDLAVATIVGAKLGRMTVREHAIEDIPDVHYDLGRAIGRDNPEEIAGRLVAAGAPPWLRAPLVAWLIELASAGSGGAGQISAHRLAELLRRPDALSRYLLSRSGKSRKLRSLACSLPRKRPRARRA